MKGTHTFTVALIAGLVAGCGGLSSPGGQSILVSVEKEIEIGQQVHAEIIIESPLLSDPAVVNYVAALGRQLVEVSDRPVLDRNNPMLGEYQFFVLDTEVINAFAAPGGFVYVTVGLLRRLNSRAELAGVMGHEVGHVAGLHGVREIEDQFLVGTITGWILGDESAAKNVVDFAIGIYRNTAHSRDLELEADELGIRYAHAAGYNPWGLVDFFVLLRDLVGDSNPVSEFLSSHPTPKDRIELSTAQIETIGVTKDAPILDDGAAPFMPWADFVALLPPKDTE